MTFSIEDLFPDKKAKSFTADELFLGGTEKMVTPIVVSRGTRIGWLLLKASNAAGTALLKTFVSPFFAGA